MITKALLKGCEVVGILVLLAGVIIMVVFYELKDLIMGRDLPSRNEYRSI